MSEELAAAQGRVLVLDADARRAEQLCHRLRFLNYEPVTANSEGEFDTLNDDARIAVMVGSIGSDPHAARAFEALSSTQPELPVLHMRDVSGVTPLNEGLDRHNVWALDAPLRRSQLEHLLQRALRYRGRERRMRITGNSTSIRDVRKLIEQVSDFDTTVLVTGESGTGKELVAKTVHDLSDRSDGPFVPINCGAIPPELLESELFGHEKGAFTGAVSARKGRFELAEGGTLFLDEIGDMSLPMQAKLLRVLQERKFERVGSNKTRACNIRIVAATHRDLPKAVSAGDFREDLYFRLNVFPIRMPPLRKRSSDLPALLDELLDRHHGGGKGRMRLTADAIRALASYSWPGNIRELSNLVERLAILHPEGEVDLADLPAKYHESSIRLDQAADCAGEAVGPNGLDLKGHLQKIERSLIQKALQEADGVVAKAARLLKLRRTTLVEKLGKYDLD